MLLHTGRTLTQQLIRQTFNQRKIVASAHINLRIPVCWQHPKGLYLEINERTIILNEIIYNRTTQTLTRTHVNGNLFACVHTELNEIQSETERKTFKKSSGAKNKMIAICMEWAARRRPAERNERQNWLLPMTSMTVLMFQLNTKSAYSNSLFQLNWMNIRICHFLHSKCPPIIIIAIWTRKSNSKIEILLSTIWQTLFNSCANS